MSPASTRPLSLTSTGVAACLSTVRVATRVVVVVVVSGADVTAAPVGGVPLAVAVLATEPESTSAWAIV